ncbi:hypothetical protein LCGC14_0313020 [marine sediment metagenome]|uniref:Uncharacterized protein n=1 Tax=marine sediment metagenome TaxID=412755 RepID=A0A0F9TLK5_9ZZZZ
MDSHSFVKAIVLLTATMREGVEVITAFVSAWRQAFPQRAMWGCGQPEEE